MRIVAKVPVEQVFDIDFYAIANKMIDYAKENKFFDYDAGEVLASIDEDMLNDLFGEYVSSLEDYDWEKDFDEDGQFIRPLKASLQFILDKEHKLAVDKLNKKYPKLNIPEDAFIDSNIIIFNISTLREALVIESIIDTLYSNDLEISLLDKTDTEWEIHIKRQE